MLRHRLYGFILLCVGLGAPTAQASCENFTAGIVGAVSSANRYAEAVMRLTGRKAVLIQEKHDYGPEFQASFRPNDPEATLVKISQPPTPEEWDLLRRLKITHLFPGPVSLHCTQDLCRGLGIQMVGTDAEVLTDKARQQEVLGLAGQTPIPGMIVLGRDAALRAFHDLGQDVVIKPNEGWGTRGVKFVSSAAEITTSPDILAAVEHGALMEKRIHGVEYFADFVSFENPQTGLPEHRLLNVARYRKVELKTHAPIYSSIRILPYMGIMQTRLATQGRAALHAFHMKNGITHAEFMLETRHANEVLDLISGTSVPHVELNNRIFSIEYNFRKPGGDVPYYFRKYAVLPTDFNHTDAAILAVYDPMRLATQPEGWTLQNHLDISFLFARRKGRFDLTAVKALEEQYPGIVKEVVLPSYSHGAVVDITADLFDALGKVVISHPDPNEVTRVSQEIHDMCMRDEFLLPE